MASFVTHFLNVMFRHMPIIEDTEEERRKNAARPLPKPPKGVKVGDAGLSVPCELVEKQGNGDIFVLNIHGGGFTTGSAKETRALSFYTYCKGIIGTRSKARVLPRYCVKTLDRALGTACGPCLVWGQNRSF